MTTNPVVFRILTEDLEMPEDEALSQLENNTLDLGIWVAWDITDDILITIAENCAELTSINLGFCDNITNAGVMGVAENCAGLTTISLCACWIMTDAAVTALAENCAGLTMLNLWGCESITDTAIIALAENCAGLTDINLGECYNITDAAIIALAENCKYLKKINYVSTKVSATGRQLIEEIKTRPKPPPLEEGWWMDDGTEPQCKGMMN
jgi:hypothetical protein